MNGPDTALNRSVVALVALQLCTKPYVHRDMTRKNFWLIGLSVLPLAQGFYLPGAAPKDYKENDRIDLFVNTLKPKGGSTTPKLASEVHNKCS